MKCAVIIGGFASGFCAAAFLVSGDAIELILAAWNIALAVLLARKATT